MKERLIAFFTARLGLVFGFLRCFLPLLKVGKLTLVTRFRDVQMILHAPNAFGVVYAEKMAEITGGSNFFLGMNDTPTYERDLSNMRLLMPRTDLETRIRPLLEGYANAIASDLPDEFDLVDELSLRVPCHFAAEYMGVLGLDEKKLQTWTSDMFWYLFFPEYPEEVEKRALAAAAELRAALDQIIEERKAAGTATEDVINRSLRLQAAGAEGMTDADIRNNLIGVLIGLVPTTAKATALVLDFLLDHPKQLAQAREFAQQDKNAELAKVVLESLRFKPFSPGVFRVSLQDQRIPGTRKRIRQGERLLLATQSAMMDARVLRRPGQYALDRPMEIYMPFGYGHHTCFGLHINLVQIPAILKPLLKWGVGRAAGQARGGTPESANTPYCHLRLRRQ